MIVKFGRFGWRALLVWMECLAIVVGLALLGGIVFSWRLGTGPVDVSFARETLEEALQDPVSGYSVKLGGIVLEWPDMSGPIVLQLSDVGLIKNSKEVLNIGEVGLGISTTHLLRASIRPVSITLTNSSLHLIRTEDNRIVLSLEDDSEGIPDEAGDENPLMRIVNMLSRPEGSIDVRSPIGHLRSVEINNATMVMEDHVLGISWYLQNTNIAFARTEDGLEVRAGIYLPGGRTGAAAIQIGAVYDRFKKNFQVAAHISDLDLRIISRKVDALAFFNDQEIYFDGDLNLSISDNLEVLGAAASIQAVGGVLNLADIYDRPLAFQRASFAGSYDPMAGTVNVQEAFVRAYDIELKVSSLVTISQEKISAPVKIEIPALPQEKIKEIWPAVLHGEPIEAWLLERLSKGSIDDIRAAFTIDAARSGEAWATDVTGITSEFDISGMRVDYRAPLMPAENTFGHGKLENDVLRIAINSATVGDMSVTGGEVSIDNIASDKVGNAKILVSLHAALPSLFKFIESEPIGMKGDKLGLDTKNVRGDTALDVEVSFPTLRDLPKDKVKVKAVGTLNNVLLPDVVKTLDLTDGPMKLTVAEGKALLSGEGKLDGRPVKIDWEQFLESDGKPYDSKIKAQLAADRDLRGKLNIGLDDWLEGTVPVKVDYTEYQDGRGEVLVDGDLKQATVKVSPFDYSKPPGIDGAVTCTAILQKGVVQEIKDLNVRTPELDVKGGLMVFDSVNGANVLQRGNIARVKLNETDTMLDFEIGAGGRLKVGLRGAFFDARPFLKKKRKKGPYEGPPVLASVDVAKMRSSDTHVVSKAKIYLDLNKSGLVDQLELDALAGKGALYMRLKPDPVRDVTVFRFEADDAGEALRAFDVYKNVRGGKIALSGESLPGKSRYAIFGKAQLSDFNVVNAPALAVLVSAISPTGLPMLLSNDGLYFSRLESKFAWYLRQPGDIYEVSDGRTSGSSLGLTFEGRINKEAGAVDIKGHVVPMSEINSLISNIPLIGQILTGGSSGGVFAATYTMTGPTEKPVVSVNPLSVLTPGIIRRILFED